MSDRFTPSSESSLSSFMVSSCFSRMAASLVFVTALMNLINRSPYRSGGIADIWDSVFAMPLIKCSMRLTSEY